MYENIKNEILFLNFKPGDSIKEKYFEEKFSVSRTPVREAFLKLKQEGLIEIFPQKGTFISLIDINLIKQVYFLRKNLEVPILKEIICIKENKDFLFKLTQIIEKQKYLIQQNGKIEEIILSDMEFHKEIFSFAQKQELWNFILSYFNDFIRIKVLTYKNFKMEKIINEHSLILKILENKNEEEIINYSNLHFSVAEIELNKVVQMYSDYFN
ncbi:MAG: GntR family transcriptional regulator [Cetobacterium sp.]|uniref:GntR family transcriptional regulator n=1 Tax=unclassified Cetobacterium TaxID=2630983 RepID=UPI00163C502A|nr:GntR family transcriptional regulator [Cetobacterium sp. 2A]